MAFINSNKTLRFPGTIQYRRASQKDWEVFTYVPAEGEICVATDTGEIRIGNGKNTWTDLPSPYAGAVEQSNPFLNFDGIELGNINYA